jgi:hypothetical protein
LILIPQQSNRIANASTEIGIRNGYSGFNREIYSSAGIAELLSKAKDSSVEWDSVEDVNVLTVAMDLLNVWLSVETACDHGLAQASTCAELNNDIRALVTLFPGTRPVWRFVLDGYPGLANTAVYSTISLALEE